MRIEVVNIRSDYYRKLPYTYGEDEELVYIGRSSIGLSASPLANPFKVKINGIYDRDLCIDKYENWIKTKIIENDSEACNELNILTDILIRKKILYLCCWCKPKACHGDIIKKILNIRIKLFKIKNTQIQ